MGIIHNVPYCPHQNEGLPVLEPGCHHRQVLLHPLGLHQGHRVGVQGRVPELLTQHREGVHPISNVQQAALTRHPIRCRGTGTGSREGTYMTTQAWHSLVLHSSLSEIVDEVCSDVRHHICSEAPRQRHDEVMLASCPQGQMAEGRIQETHLWRHTGG